MVRFYPAGMLSPVPIQKVSINACAPALPHKHLLELQRNVLVHISYVLVKNISKYGDYVDLSIKTESIQKERMMTQTAVRNS